MSNRYVMTLGLVLLLTGCAGRGLPTLTEVVPEGNSGVRLLDVTVSVTSPMPAGYAGADGFLLEFFNGSSLPPGTYELPNPRDSSRSVTIVIGPDGKASGGTVQDSNAAP